jgi:CP family cyanate transporter-like MFS transporter
MPALVRQWFPERRMAPRATAFWSNGLIVGELLPASLTIPLVLPLVGSWEASFVVWSVPVLLTAVLVSLLTRQQAGDAGLWHGSGLPNFRAPRLWQLGLLQASASLVYFGGNTFIPDYLHATEQADLVGPALATLNTAQLPASLVLGVVPLRLLAGRLVPIGLAVAIASSLLVVLFVPGPTTVVAAGVLGFCSAFILVLSLTMPNLLAAPGDVARMSAGAFAISYSTTFVVTLLAGAIWDATHVAGVAFLPAMLSIVLVLAFAPRLTGLAVEHGLRGVQPDQQGNQHRQAVGDQPAVKRSNEAGQADQYGQSERHQEELQAQRREAGGEHH